MCPTVAAEHHLTAWPFTRRPGRETDERAAMLVTSKGSSVPVRSAASARPAFSALPRGQNDSWRLRAPTFGLLEGASLQGGTEC